jgi:hypothetical protein
MKFVWFLIIYFPQCTLNSSEEECGKKEAGSKKFIHVKNSKSHIFSSLDKSFKGPDA